MKKILLLALVIFSVVFGYLIAFPNLVSDKEVHQETAFTKESILKVTLVADSHNENELLEKALSQAGEQNVDFVIGLGDYTNLGTVEELAEAEAVFDKSGLEYYVIPGDRDGWESREKGEANIANFSQVFTPNCHSRESGNLEPWAPDQVRGDICGVQVFDRERVHFVILDNSDIYRGIALEDWSLLEEVTKVSKVSNVTNDANTFETLETFETSKLTFVFAHKAPFHPESKHVMGEDSPQVAVQAKKFMDLMEATYSCHSVLDTESSDWIPHQVRDDKCPSVDGFFSGDIHFFAQFKSPGQSVKITTIGAVASERNFQGPRFAILTVYNDYSWEVEDVEIR